MDLMQIVREEASKVYTNEAQLNAFMGAFEKTASEGSMEKLATLFPTGLGPQIMKEVGLAVPKVIAGIGGAVLGIGALKALTSGVNAVHNARQQSQFESALSQVMSTNKTVRGYNPTKVRSYAQTIYQFAPTVASDPNLLSTLLSHAVLGEGVDPTIIKSVTDLEGRYQDNMADQSPLGFPRVPGL